METDGNKLYINIVELEEIYNFLIDYFIIWGHLRV